MDEIDVSDASDVSDARVKLNLAHCVLFCISGDSATLTRGNL